VFGECDVCEAQVRRQYRNVPGTGSYAEPGLYCGDHGMMIPEHVVYRQNSFVMRADEG
jgi:hypothetical protein